jgi:hypothetical protein
VFGCADIAPDASLTPPGMATYVSIQGSNFSYSTGSEHQPDSPATSTSLEWYRRRPACSRSVCSSRNINTFVQTLAQDLPFNTLNLPDSAVDRCCGGGDLPNIRFPGRQRSAPRNAAQGL